MKKAEILGKNKSPQDIYNLMNTSTEFKLFISSKESATKGYKAKNIYVDGTHKLIDLGYPVIVIRYSDINRKFFPLSISVVENGNDTSYDWVFENLKALFLQNGLELNPETIMQIMHHL
ncbi:hypothetical protein BB559_006851 [Furculomyces boomerangus]|uniref:MULE transposase domain-containing protein n=1 Tax=Furculomyces boomerangus TaxID=61424 RepID=A0A2T9Y082_9FUNG|nr:hypothetical protein BB559_006851 [Furculomyces boomerangus]